MSKPTLIIGLVLLLVLAGIGTIIWKTSQPAGLTQTDAATLAQCLKDSGVKFYGAFWCPHCQNQKAMFGAAVDLLPYVECSMPDAQHQTQICIDKKITGYPTWEFADGSRLTGEISPADLAAKTSCPLPKS